MARCSYDLCNIWPDDVYVVVGPGALVQPGDTTVTIPQFVGWKTRFYRNKMLVYLTNPNNGEDWYDYTSITGTFTLDEQAVQGESMVFVAYKPECLPGGTSRVTQDGSIRVIQPGQ